MLSLFDSFFVPRPGILRDRFRMGGAIRVVNSVISMMTPKSCSLRMPAVIPIPAIMSATSPRGTIPAPTLKAPFMLKPRPRDGRAHPSIFAAIATTVYRRPNASTSQDMSAPTFTSIPMTAKNSGTKNSYRPWMRSWITAAISVLESESPVT